MADHPTQIPVIIDDLCPPGHAYLIDDRTRREIEDWYRNLPPGTVVTGSYREPEGTLYDFVGELDIRDRPQPARFVIHDEPPSR